MRRKYRIDWSLWQDGQGGRSAAFASPLFASQGMLVPSNSHPNRPGSFISYEFGGTVALCGEEEAGVETVPGETESPQEFITDMQAIRVERELAARDLAQLRADLQYETNLRHQQRLQWQYSYNPQQLSIEAQKLKQQYRQMMGASGTTAATDNRTLYGTLSDSTDASGLGSLSNQQSVLSKLKNWL